MGSSVYVSSSTTASADTHGVANISLGDVNDMVVGASTYSVGGVFIESVLGLANVECVLGLADITVSLWGNQTYSYGLQTEWYKKTFRLRGEAAATVIAGESFSSTARAVRVEAVQQVHLEAPECFIRAAGGESTRRDSRGKTVYWLGKSRVSAQEITVQSQPQNLVIQQANGTLVASTGASGTVKFGAADSFSLISAEATLGNQETQTFTCNSPSFRINGTKIQLGDIPLG